MEIKINDKTIQLKKSFRSLIAYESATGKPFSPKTVTDSIMYFYCVIISSESSVEITFDEFMDWLDDNPKALSEFTEWLIKQNEADNILAKKKTVRTKKNS